MKGVFILILALMMVSVAAAEDIVVKKSRILSEVVTEYEDLLVLVDLKNPGWDDLEDVKVQFTVLETGDHAESGFFDLDGKDRDAKLYYVPLEDARAGVYTLKITIFNDDVRRVKYRHFEVR